MTHLIRDWMTPNPITINGDNTLSIAYNLMRINDVRHLPVVNDDDKLIGVLTWGDVREARPNASASKSQHAQWEGHFLAAIRDVREFMTPMPRTASGDMPIAEAARLMMEQRIGCLPIVDDGQVIGIVTEVDLFRFIIETQRQDEQKAAEKWTESESAALKNNEPNRSELNNGTLSKSESNNRPNADKVYPWMVQSGLRMTAA